MMNRTFLTAGERSVLSGILLGLLASAIAALAQTPLDPSTLTRYIDELPRPGVLAPSGTLHGAPYYEVEMVEVQQQLHSELPPTTLWTYNGTFPGPVIQTVENRPVYVRWINNLPTEHLLEIDHAIHGAEEEYPDVRAVVHLHGGHVPAESDGGPEDWFTPGHSATYLYPNRQPPATLWFHDHAMGITRLNVMAGLAGLYIIRDRQESRFNLPTGEYEIPLALQDRKFDTNGQLLYPETWEPEFFGDVSVVNGKIWPRLTVEPRKYRFRFLGGGNARFFNLKLLESDEFGQLGANPASGPAFYQIGSDGGFLSAPVVLNDPLDPASPRLLLGPGERADVIIDFSGFAGQYFVLHNNAKCPFKGLASDAEDDAPLPELMLFEVQDVPTVDRSAIPARFDRVPRTSEWSARLTRDLALEEIMGEDGPIGMMLGGAMYSDPVTERPQLGTTEIWRMLNCTEDTHPMHLHLVQFQILDRQPFNVEHYMMTGEVHFTGPRRAPEPNEMGWKDTFSAYPGEATRIIARFTDYAGRYVWHCHILEHEENEMMRPFEVIKGETASPLDEAPLPAQFALAQNSPNPFNPATTIAFTLPEAGPARLRVFNLLGEEVARLVDGDLAAGTHEVNFDAAALPSGVYFYRLTAAGRVADRKMVLLK